MYQINNMRRVRFIHPARYIYYIYLRYSAMRIWCKTHRFYRRSFMVECVRVWSVFLFAWFMNAIKSCLLGRWNN